MTLRSFTGSSDDVGVYFVIRLLPVSFQESNYYKLYDAKLVQHCPCNERQV
jgi:hypothetical protein